MYNKERNEVWINGCYDCPFLNHLNLHCHLGVDLNIRSLNAIPEYFPNDCPLRDTNFKLIRNF